MTDLLSVSAARQRLLQAFQPVASEDISLAQAHGRVLAADIFASEALPPFDNSSMDGFALQAADTPHTPTTLRVVADIPAGQFPAFTLQPGQAARIMTGAPLPAGADAVIPVEDTDFPGREPGLPLPPAVQVFRTVNPGAFVRPRGQDIQPGERVLPAGALLRPPEVGLLALLGVAQVRVHRCPRVAILVTGDELLPVDAPLQPGMIHESNSLMLAGQVHSCGGEAQHLGIIPDQAEAVQAALDRAVAAQVDVILSSAGVSVGAFDYVRQVVAQHGTLDFWRVNMRPGKPLAFGAYRGVPFIGLPGNPVSSFVGFEVFVRPALQRLAGRLTWQPLTVSAELTEPVESDGRESYLRATLTWQDGRWLAQLAGHQGSGNLRGLTLANALLIIPSEVKSLPFGARVTAQWIGPNP